MAFVFDPKPTPAIAIAGDTRLYPIARIFCVGRNYAAHAAEMGSEVDREAPWYFTKSAHAFCPSGVTVPYPQGTSNYHHEVELAVALGAPVFEADQQQDGKDHRRPWSLGKDVENSAVIAPLLPAAEFGKPAAQSISLDLNGETKQTGALSQMVWSVSEIIAHLSRFYHLGAGDVILTGTPSGVGPAEAGDEITAKIDGLPPLHHKLGNPV